MIVTWMWIWLDVLKTNATLPVPSNLFFFFLPSCISFLFGRWITSPTPHPKEDDEACDCPHSELYIPPNSYFFLVIICSIY